MKKNSLNIIFFVVVFSATTIFASNPRDYEPGQMIVKQKGSSGFTLLSTNKVKEYARNKGANFVKRIIFPQKKYLLNSSEQGNCYLLSFSPDTDIYQKSEEIRNEDWVEYAEPNYYIYTHDFPNDPKYINQFYISQTELKKIFYIPENNEVIIGLIDSGIDSSHPDIVNSLFRNQAEILNNLDDDKNGYIDDVAGYDFSNYSNGLGSHIIEDKNGHGTHLAGVISAIINNNIGVAGLSSKAKLINLKFINGAGRGTQVDAAAAVRYAVDMGARIINCSWGYFKYTKILENAIKYAIDNNVIVLASVGNENSVIRTYPAFFDGVIGIGSISIAKTRSYFSNYGNVVDFTMYGENLYSLKPGMAYGEKSGTSQSTAVMSAIAARILSYNQNLNSKNVEDLFIRSAVDINQPGKDYYTGYGYISILKLFNELNIPVPGNPTPPTNIEEKEPDQNEKNILQMIIEVPIRIIAFILDIFI
jgi:serine protease